MPFRSDAFDEQIGRTNAPLTEHEAIHARNRLTARIKQVRRIDAYLRHGQVTNRADILKDRSAVLSIINQYQIALAPHKRLPVELLQHIFLYVFAFSKRTTPCIAEAPLLLCRVSSFWRQTALGMPHLWQSLHFYFEKDYTALQKVQAAQIYFSRAGNLPLSLTLTDTSEDFTDIDFVQEVIIPFSHDFRCLQLVLRPPQVKRFFSLPLGSLDVLEELHLAMYIGISPASILPAWKPPITVFGSSSSLRRLRIQLTPFVVPQIFHFPLNRLETFRCDSSLQSADCHELLLSCQSLRQLHVRIFGIQHSGVPRFEIPLLNLTHFYVHLCDQEPYDLFFLPFILPSLRSLMIYQYDGLPWSPGMLNGLVERSACNIEELYLGTVEVEARDVAQLFVMAPRLKSITFSHTTIISASVFESLGRNEIGTCLEQLLLKGTRELEPLLNMLEMREKLLGLEPNSDGVLNTSSLLKFLETCVKQEETFIHAARIQRLQSAGVQISLLQNEETSFHL